MKSVRFPWKPFKPTKIYLKTFFRFVFSLPAVQIDVACKPCNAEMLNIDHLLIYVTVSFFFRFLSVSMTVTNFSRCFWMDFITNLTVLPTVPITRHHISLIKMTVRSRDGGKCSLRSLSFGHIKATLELKGTRKST